MGRCLRIFNVSEYVHAGAVPKKSSSNWAPPNYYAGVRELPDGNWGKRRLPTGGFAFMLNPVFELLTSEETKDDVLVFAVDDTPFIKRKMYKELLHDETGYKGTRPQKHIDVAIQREGIADILRLFSENVFKIPGYEADDLIAEIVKKYSKDFDHTYIYTRDHDIYCLVDDKVSVLPVGTVGKYVTKKNFDTTVVSKKDYYVPYNGIILDKLFYGDSSDNIPGIGASMINKIKAEIPEENYKFLTNFNLLRAWVRRAVEDDALVMGLLELLIPLSVHEDIILSDESISMSRLAAIGYLVQNKYCRKKRGIDPNDYPEMFEILNYYTDEYYMRGGTFHV